VRHLLTAKGNVVISVLTATAVLLLGIASVSSAASAQQEEQAPKPKIGSAVSILSDVKGADFGPYMRAMHDSIMHSLSAKLPESVKHGQKGVVGLRGRLQKDGSFSDDSLTITTSSGKDDMDAATLSALRAAAPFGPFPEGYRGSNLELKFIFYYNLPLQKPTEKSSSVPSS
jgi:TonB family protein